MSSAELPISNHFLNDAGSLDALSPDFGDARARLRQLKGHYAVHLGQGSGVELLARDPLGVNKLFFAVDSQGVHSANYFIDLVRRGFPPSRIWSVPSGHCVRIQLEQRSLVLEKHTTLQFDDETPANEDDLPRYGQRIFEELAQVFTRLRAHLAGRPLVITLSGGLDSTAIAAMAREYIGPFTAVTFATHEPGEERRVHSDLHFATKVAADLGVPLEVVEIAPSSLPELLDEVLTYGQDFRDFNVHCGLVNAVLARYIGSKFAGATDQDRACVLTGDTSNELVADYTPVAYGNEEFYSLPKLEPGRLRRFLVSGLDTGDREVGLFARHRVDTIQPYALIAQAYASLPGGFLNDERAKQTLVRCMMGDKIPAYIYDRPKVRAQVADSSKVGGTMAALLDRGIDSEYLVERFCQLSGFDRQGLKHWIRGGLYRFTASFPEST